MPKAGRGRIFRTENQNDRNATMASTHLLERALDMLHYALIIVDEGGRIEFKNRTAAALLRDADNSLAAHGNTLSLSPREMRGRLMHAIRKACHASELSGLSVPRGGHDPLNWLRLVVAPLEGIKLPCAAIWAFGENAVRHMDHRLLATLFGLTPAESRLALGLLGGYTTDEYASEAGVGVATVRSQLHSIFTKTGARRQAELISLLHKVPALRVGKRS